MQPLTRPSLSLIAAVTPRGGIGKNNGLLWHEPLDQKHFRQLTMGYAVIMGRKTWDSLPERFRPLPGRNNIVLTRNTRWQAAGALVASSLDVALEHAAGSEKVFVIGGAEIYALALPRAEELILTEIDQDFDSDAHFPEWDHSIFKECSREHHIGAGGIGFSFVRYLRET